MRKPLALIASAMLALSLAPIASHASSQCPGAQPDPGDLTGQDYKQGVGEIIYMRSGPAQLPDNPAYETGMVNLGTYGCEKRIEDGVVDTRYITPGSTVLQVVAINYPDSSDNPPAPGCLKFATTVPTTLCNGSGEKKLTWSFEPFFPETSLSFRWDSQVLTIPSGATGATACATLREYGADKTAAKRYCTTYKTLV